MITTRSAFFPILFTLLLSGCSDSDPETSSTDGKELYSLYCEACHKSNGSGKFLEGIPANRSTRLSYNQVVALVRKGDPARPDMPAFVHLTDKQADAIVDYLFSLRIY
ncbi:cytochrome c [uncultured Amphritea sp.]|uniref:c-type cytochrome n=1 Tax=uncultured Amphritea sp. TaxID=981605 RepID=UPI00343322E9